MIEQIDREKCACGKLMNRDAKQEDLVNIEDFFKCEYGCFVYHGKVQYVTNLKYEFLYAPCILKS